MKLLFIVLICICSSQHIYAADEGNPEDTRFSYCPTKQAISITCSEGIRTIQLAKAREIWRKVRDLINAPNISGIKPSPYHISQLAEPKNTLCIDTSGIAVTSSKSDCSHLFTSYVYDCVAVAATVNNSDGVTIVGLAHIFREDAEETNKQKINDLCLRMQKETGEAYFTLCTALVTPLMKLCHDSLKENGLDQTKITIKILPLLCPKGVDVQPVYASQNFFKRLTEKRDPETLGTNFKPTHISVLVGPSGAHCTVGDFVGQTGFLKNYGCYFRAFAERKNAAAFEWGQFS